MPPLADNEEPPQEERVRLLHEGEVQVLGRMPYSSNATLLVELCDRGSATRAVYKPGRGERPLWDFPPGLYRREVAAYELSAALGWEVVPVTILRDGPLGEGSLQLFVDADFEEHYFTLYEAAHDVPTYHGQLQRICLFDLLANNTDRKGGHCLLGRDGHIWAIDNSLCFHAEPKLRTVLWDFAGEPVPDLLLEDVARFAERPLPQPLAALLDPFEREALTARAHAVLRSRVFPHDPTGRRWPWPVV